MIRRITLLLSVLFIICLSNSAFAQNAIKGFVYDNASGEPLTFCRLQLAGTQYGTMSDKNGSFIISKIPAGDYTLLITAFGYDTIKTPFSIKENEVISKKYHLSPSKVSLSAVEVSAEGGRVITETRTSVISVSPKEIKKMPSIGGQPDFAQYLQVLPGIISTGDQGGQLYVRGGTPIQNMVLLDGMLIYNPFHSIGLFSVFDTDIINTADVYTGGFGAEFGGRISSVMDIQTRDGNKKRISGKVDVNTFGAKLLLEGPFVKDKEGRKATLGYILSAKGSYLEQSSKALYNYVDSSGLPYNFLDIYAKLSLNTQGGSKLSFFGFNFADKVNYSEIAEYKWNNYGIGTNFLVIPGNIPITLEGTIAYSNYTIELNDRVYEPRNSSINGFNVDLNFSYYIGKSVLNIGAEFIGYTTKYEFYNSIGRKISLVDYTTDLGIFAKYKYNFRDKLLIEPSFRLQYFASMGTASPEPRLALKYNITPKIRLKLAGGLYSQNYVAATSDRDVVNLFYGFLSSPDNLPSEFDGKDIKNNLQKAQHIVLGLELDLIKYTHINIEGYYKNFSQVVVLNRYKIYEDTEDYTDKPAINRQDYIFEKGNAFGGDISVKFDYKGIYLWFVYSLGWVNRYDGVVDYNPHFDRRHNINVLASYAFGKRGSWQVDVRWNFGSGFPFTQTQGFYPYYMPGSGIGDDYITTNEELGITLAELNKGRLPHYHRLDINFKKKFFIGQRNIIELNVGATNVYDYRNIFYVNRVTSDIIYQLPILYSVGVTWTF